MDQQAHPVTQPTSPATRRPLARRAAIAAPLLTLVVFCALGVSVARAGSFAVTACGDAPSQANNSWVAFNTAPTYLQTSTDCSSGPSSGEEPFTSGLAASDVLGLSTLVPQNASAGWSFTAPPATTITSATLQRDLYKSSPPGWQLFVDEQGTPLPGQDCSIPTGAFECETSGSLNLPDINATALTVGLSCQSTGCVNGFSEHVARAELDAATVTLTDGTPPSTPILDGPILNGWQTGTAELDVSSSDPVGVRSITATSASGTPLASASLPCDFTHPVPCAAASEVPLTIDTTGLPAGADQITVAVTDAAQNTTTATATVLVDNGTLAAPTLSGAPVGWTAQPTATITATTPRGAAPVQSVSWELCQTACGSPTFVTVPAAATTVSFAVAVPADGAYTVQARDIDAAGHPSATASTPFDVDQTPPAAPTLTATAATGGPITAHWSDPPHPAPITTASSQLCDAAGDACQAPTTGADTGVLQIPATAGIHKLRVWLGDAAGNSSSANAASVTVSVPIAPLPAGPTAPSSAASLATEPALASTPGAHITLPPAVAKHGVTFKLAVTRRSHGMLTIKVTRSPALSGAMTLHLRFAGHPTEIAHIRLHRGVASRTIKVPGKAATLTIGLHGLNATGVRTLRLTKTSTRPNGAAK
jgi:hypothetical protein